MNCNLKLRSPRNVPVLNSEGASASGCLDQDETIKWPIKTRPEGCYHHELTATVGALTARNQRPPITGGGGDASSNQYLGLLVIDDGVRRDRYWQT